MCELASFEVTKNKVFWSKTSDRHQNIIEEFDLHKDGAYGPNSVSVEISPEDGDLSRPLKQWKFKVDQDQLPYWWDAKEYEKTCRIALKDWAKFKLSGWKVHEAFHPIHPFKRAPRRNLNYIKYLKEWGSVRDSVWDSVRDSVWGSVGDSVWGSVGGSVRDSVWGSVRDSVWGSVRDSVWAYIGALFPNITIWQYAKELGPTPWGPLRKLWCNGYVPSFDGKVWRLHAGPDAKVVFEIEKEKLLNA